MRVRGARVVDDVRVASLLREPERSLPIDHDPICVLRFPTGPLRVAAVVEVDDARVGRGIEIHASGCGGEVTGRTQLREDGLARTLVLVWPTLKHAGSLFFEIETDDGDLWAEHVTVGLARDVVPAELSRRHGGRRTGQGCVVWDDRRGTVLRVEAGSPRVAATELGVLPLPTGRLGIDVDPGLTVLEWMRRGFRGSISASGSASSASPGDTAVADPARQWVPTGISALVVEASCGLAVPVEARSYEPAPINQLARAGPLHWTSPDPEGAAREVGARAPLESLVGLGRVRISIAAGRVVVSIEPLDDSFGALEVLFLRIRDVIDRLPP